MLLAVLLPDEEDELLLALLEPTLTRVTLAGKVRPGKASTEKLALWPSFTCPTSASSTETSTSICVRSSAMVKSTGALSEAATVWPGSISRDSTTPVTGDTICAMERLVWAVESWACETCTCACAERRLASAEL